MKYYYAHSGRDASSDRLDWQLLRDHLLAVSREAKRFGSDIEIQGRSLGPAAYAAGLFHDLGKYRPGFQSKIFGAPPPDKTSTYHKQAGAAKAWQRKHYAVAFAIAGHHGGLPDRDGLQKAVRHDSGESAAAALWPEAIADCPELARCDWPTLISGGSSRDDSSLLFDLETRLLFSCLVDSDWTDTSEHDRRVKGWAAEPGPPRLTKETAESWLTSVLARIRTRADECKNEVVRQARADVLQAALKAAAESSPGFFTLEVPTGGGKTLAGLAFALKHATEAKNGLRRIIYIAPYLSILDQNAREIREALGVARDGPAVFEHHSLSDPSSDTEEGDEQREERRAVAARRAENWDAPVIVTTNVQFLESLFSNEPGRCRKLHNIARSVIVLDECQAIPARLLAPTCGMLRQLVEHLGCTIVLATATQPTLNHPELHARGAGLSNVRPIVPPELDLFARLRRVHVEWPRAGEFLDWNDASRLMIGGEGKAQQAALCVVNTKRAARELFQILKEQRPNDVFHLSTWMCPAHRLNVLDQVKARLAAGQPCYLVSTQLIEAGVNVDFPIVLREMAPLEAIIQAAGRCNREGNHCGPDGTPGGRVIVFHSRAAKENKERYFPRDPWYVLGRDVLETFFLGTGRLPSIDDPKVIKDYFERLLNWGELDQPGIRKLRESQNFPKVCKLYRLIEESGSPVVAATWPEHENEIRRLINEVRERPTRSRFRALAPYQVNLSYPTGRQLAFVEEGPHGLAIWRGGYEPDMGLWDELLVEQTII